MNINEDNVMVYISIPVIKHGNMSQWHNAVPQGPGYTTMKKKPFLCLKINILNLHLYFDNIVKIKTELSVFSS